MGGKGHSDEVSDGQVIKHERKGNPCYKVATDLAELCSCSSLVESRICEQ